MLMLDKYPANICNIWAPAAHFLRSGIEDCDGVLLFTHYALNFTGYGLHLEGSHEIDGKISKYGHAVYIYPENGLYGIISIHRSQYKKAQYKTIDDAANSFANDSRYDKYMIFYLPNDEETVLYDFDAKKEVKKSEFRRLSKP